MPLDLAQFVTATPERGRSTEVVVEALREAILTGHLAPGAWLREEDVARQLGVSRTPVREAIRRLTEEHLVAKTAGSGTIVTAISYEDVKALYAVRTPVEGVVARLAAEHRSDALVAELRSIHEAMVQADEKNDVAGFALGNLRFHRALSDATGSLYLQRFMTQIENFVRRLPSVPGSEARREEVIAEHLAIIEAVDDGNPDRAESAAVHHMSMVGEGRLRRL